MLAINKRKTLNMNCLYGVSISSCLCVCMYVCEREVMCKIMKTCQKVLIEMRQDNITSFADELDNHLVNSGKWNLRVCNDFTLIKYTIIG